jgi:hypothetical protein
VYACFVCHAASATAAVLREKIKDALCTIAVKLAILILKKENNHKAKDLLKAFDSFK